MENQELKYKIAYLIAQLDRLGGYFLNYSFERFGHPITREQWAIIRLLYDKNGQSQQEIANALLKNKASITNLLVNLEKKDLVERKTNKFDKRSNLVYLTGHGREMREKLEDFVYKITNLASKGISDEDLARCYEILQKMNRNISDASKDKQNIKEGRY